MPTTVIRHLAAAFMAIVAGSTTAIAGGDVFTRGCAARDMQLTMMIEETAISAQARSDAVRTVRHARVMCFDGYVMDALSIYDDVARSIAAE